MPGLLIVPGLICMRCVCVSCVVLVSVVGLMLAMLIECPLS